MIAVRSYFLWVISWLDATFGGTTIIFVGSGGSYLSGGLFDSRSPHGKGFVDTRSGYAKSMGCEVCSEISSGRSSGLLAEERNGSGRLVGRGTIYTDTSVVPWGPEIGKNVRSGAKGWRALCSVPCALEPGEGSSSGGSGTTGDWWSGWGDAIIKCSGGHEDLVDKIPRVHGHFPSVGSKAVKVVLQIALAV